jgi:hypothetical protein
MQVADAGAIKIGDTLQDILPSSSTCDLSFAANWASGDNKILLEILAGPDYPVICNCYPDGETNRRPVPINQGQSEIITPPSVYKIVKIYQQVEVTITQVRPTVMEMSELEGIFAVARTAATEKKLAEQKRRDRWLTVTEDNRKDLVEKFDIKTHDEIMKSDEGAKVVDLQGGRWTVLYNFEYEAILEPVD